jgi:serine/threonine protein kinase
VLCEIKDFPMKAASPESTQQAIGRYQILDKLADKPMGAVFKARDPQNRKIVAIKLATAALARDKVLIKRFEQEFRTANSLNHPNIVRALEFGWEGDRPYMAMEFVDGEDMWSRIEQLGRIPPAEAVGYIVQVAQGLHEAHKYGIIHRDIKPDNILITADGQAKLSDLGLSKDLETDQGLTRNDMGLGTPNFIAPEQFRDAKNAGVRCDVYGLGATLYMAITGKLPFDGRNLAAILKMKMANELVGPRELVPDLAEPIEWAIRRALIADPQRRFATVPEFLAALTGEAGASTASPRGSVGVPQGKKGKRPDKERRASVRYDCALQTPCTMVDSLHAGDTELQTQWDAEVSNLSVAGIGLLVSRRFEPGSILTVSLTNGNAKKTLEVRVVRVERAEGRRWFLGGVLAQKLTKEELRSLL